ncbi:uncharacterized protein [Amphiura filiformis]|uniref:uncharacterized protein n=1 Tax=Amphiura filiformis TaxID=82378 RepID=UPI003B2171E1
MYHFGCGVENRALFLFYDNFISYCQVHRPQQDEPELPSESPTSTCPICLESVEAKVSDDTLRTPCCTNSWFHRICVQRQALSAGYFFRCGICNNKEDFQREMKQFGIYIPEQDAAWELEDNAYQELHQRHNQCDIEPCICPKGRKYHPSRGQWEVVLCDTCGSRGCHLTCGGLANQWDDWVCDQCEEVVDKINKSRWGQQGAKPKKSSKKTSTKSTTPKEKRKEKRKEKLMGKSPRTPLPSHIPVKKKAAPSTCPSLSPPSPSDSMAQLSIHLPSVSASPNDGLYLTDSNQCSSTPCSNQKSSGSSKKKGQCYTPCKDQSNSCRKHLALSSNCSPPYGSPPHFCCTSQDSFAHSHESSIPHLSVEMNVKNPQKHPQHKGHHVCHKYGSSVSQPAVKTTSRMSMRGPATGQLAFKRAQIQIHRHSLSGVHLCARHRQQMQHSNVASWNGTNSVGSASSTSSHNSSSSSSDDIEFGTVHLTPDGKVTSSSIKNLDMTTSKAAVVQLKPLSNIMPVLCQRVSLGSNDSESQAILGSALAKQANLGANAKPFKHTCSKRKLENKEPSAPRKKFKFGKTPPPKKVENKSPNPRKMLKNVPSPQKTAKSSTPKKMDKSAKESSSVKKKASTTPQKSPKKSTTPKKAREFISKHKGKNSPKKAGSIDKSQKKVNRPLEIQKKSTALPSPKKKLKLGKGPENKTGSAVTASSSPAKTVIKKEVASPRKMAVKTSSLFSCKPKVRKSSSPRKTSPVQIISVSSLCHKKPSPKPAAPLETAQKEESAPKVVAKKPAFKKVPAKVKKQCEMSKQATLDKFLQPLANKVASADCDLNQEPNRAVTGSDEIETGNNQTDNGGMSGKRTSEESLRATPKKHKTDDTWAMSISSSPESLEKESKEDETGAGAQKNIGNSVQSSSTGILSDLLLQSPVDLHKGIKSVTTANPEEQGNSSGILSDLLSQRPKSLPKETKSVTAANPEKQRLTRSSKRWNAHMNSGEIVFSRSPPE